MSTSLPSHWKPAQRYVPWYSPEYAEALAIQRRVGIIDLHLDCILQRRLFGYDMRKRHRAGWPGMHFIWQADLPRLRDAGYCGAVMGMHAMPWWPHKAQGEVLRQLRLMWEVAESDAWVLPVREAGDYRRAIEQGRFAMAPGVEGLHCINGEIGFLEELARQGVRCVTLAHFSKNAAATPSMGRGANEHDGLTAFGAQCIARLNALGIAIDVAHCNQRCTIEASRASSKPVFATHTTIQSVHPHRRGLGDEAIDAIVATDGAIGIMMATPFLAGTTRVNSNCIIDHYEAVIRRVGIRHVCIGTDYDGWVPLPKDQRDCRDMVKVTHGLLERGYSEADLAALFHGNALRVIEASASGG